MFRNAGLILATLGLVVFAVGCGDDDAKKVDKGTGGNTQKDTGGGGVTLDQGGGGQLDSGGGGQLDTGGGTTEGFGDKCGGTAGNCKAGFKCIGVQGGSKTNGFCTKTCPAASAGKPCTGHATGQMSFCGLSNAAKTEYYCAFLCKAQGQTWTCPTTLKCGTVTNGQAICVP